MEYADRIEQDVARWRIEKRTILVTDINQEEFRRTELPAITGKDGGSSGYSK